MTASKRNAILIRGARQNNLKNLDLAIPTNAMVVVTGVSGSGKSSLVFDTVYAEGQRRYVETFSPYARQFLDRMDRPQVDAIEGIPPAIAIDQAGEVRTSRSTVGTMTELADHFKLLYARAARLHCKGCGHEVRRDTPESIYRSLTERAAAANDPRLTLTFTVSVPKNFAREEVLKLLEAQGYTRIHAQDDANIEVTQDRFRASSAERTRVMEAIEAALRHGHGRLAIHAGDEGSLQTWKYSKDLHCADCDIHYHDASPSHFSFNSPLGACETCRGFGRVIGVDFGLVVPDASKTLREGAIKPWQTAAYRECQDDLEKMARLRGIPLDRPWRDLSDEQKHWVLEGEANWKGWSKSWPGVWYGVRRFFDWLETKAYKMHIRVLLSKYRAYTVCPACEGARLKPAALVWRLGNAQRGPLPGFNLHELMREPIADAREFMRTLALPAPLDKATEQLLAEIRARLDYLCEVGVGYLTLDRQSRTLSGGEIQRINLTTALGTSLVNTLFVLDEPSIGLHPRDVNRIIGVMEKLRDAGNSLLVVEHDPQVMLAADQLIDIGPGPGARGGEIVFQGAPHALAKADTLTAKYLCGRLRSYDRSTARVVENNGPRLLVKGAAEHNLKHIDVSIPLKRFVVLTGVSGSGKSTFMNEVLHRALLQSRGERTEAPGKHDALEGAELINEVVLVDQSAIGKSARSNPVSHVGAFDAIRNLYARAPLAVERNYTAGTFSFNAATKSGVGRCPSCNGSGFEHVEMQFLSDVYLRCPECDGRRFAGEVLDVKIAGKSIADVLDLTVSEALAFFAAHEKITKALKPLADVGLDYLRLGQPVPTLSGGEAQRLKLAGHLADSGKNTLFLFDEPTTGLHFDDIAKLLNAFDQLLENGHSLVVIEHNLDVIRAADWLIDFGPEGGDAGGQILVAGTREDLMNCPASHTGAALRQIEREAMSPPAQSLAAEPLARYTASPPAAISITGAREHNLKNLSVDIPLDAFTVITGVSGSGKSTLAFDIVFEEGQRRYLESLNAYARQFVQPASRADVDAVRGIPPTVAIEQRTSRGGRKSTVATQTEIYHFLRLIYAKLGTQYCPDCNIAIQPQSVEQILERIERDWAGQHIGILAPLITARKGLYTDLAKWAAGRGHSHLRVDGEYLPVKPWPRLDRFKEHTIELPVADCIVGEDALHLREKLIEALDLGKGVVRMLAPLDDAARGTQEIVFSTLRACHGCGTSFNEPDPRLFSFNSKHGWCPSCFGTGLELPGFDEEASGEELTWNEWADTTHAPETCPACQGARVNAIARAVKFRELGISDLTARPVSALRQFFSELALGEREASIARDVVAEIASRLRFLDDVGLGYLALDRAAPTLSGGEAQRIRLAAQLGSNLQGVCYVLDEPTIGLHPRDNTVLLDTLEKLRARGNTLVVVEHDEDTIFRADHVIDLGPGAGTRGGKIVAQGTAAQLMRNPASITGHALAHPLPHPSRPRRAVERDSATLKLHAIKLHNIQHLDIELPLGRLVAITGVSGSGKSTLARDVLRENLARLLRGETRLEGLDAISGFEQINRVMEVDQTPIGKTPRSCPATYVGIWDAIRKLFADTVESRMRGYTASRFSFNTAGGRCDACEGQGVQKIEMNFLPDVKVLCESCRGARFGPDTLEVRWREKSIGDVLAMSVDEALTHFAAHPSIAHSLKLMQDVGLGYLTLGQQSPTLSGGEAQRIKLVAELARARTPVSRRGAPQSGGALYVLDEPTVGLHMSDVAKLIDVLHRLVDAGNSVIVIEHNLDLVADADWIIDMGPEGGSAGGKLLVAGTPEAMLDVRGSHTANALKRFLERQRDQRVGELQSA